LARARTAAPGSRVTHEEFVAAYRAGRVRVTIDRAAAARFVSGRAMLPLVMLPLLGFGVALALVGYIVTGAIIFVAALALRTLVKRSSDGFLVWRALRDSDFYEQVRAAQVLNVEECSVPSRSS